MTGDTHLMWEIVKGVGIFVCTAMLAWVVKTLRAVSEGQTKLTYIVVGIDGKNGLRSTSQSHGDRLDVIEERNLVLDEVAKRERELYEGEDRRQGPQRRLRDLIREEMEAAKSNKGDRP